MKVKLLKRLRRIGRDQIQILSVTTTGGCTTGMSYSHPGEGYRELFSFGDTKEEVIERACKIYMNLNMSDIRKKYKKYSRKSSYEHTRIRR